mmetsp:Transcript_112875/g.207178  ORF Transcript_112875/g.207178 Transcript_112875/m.207178 type:complete len:1342 (-) Transcript_112875:80-4105(-)
MPSPDILFQGASKGAGERVSPTFSAKPSGKNKEMARAKSTGTRRGQVDSQVQSKNKVPSPATSEFTLADGKERDPVRLAFYEWMANDQALWVDLKKFARKVGESVASASSPGEGDDQRQPSATAASAVQQTSPATSAPPSTARLQVPQRTSPVSSKTPAKNDSSASSGMSPVPSKTTLKSDSSSTSLARSGSQRSVVIGERSEYKFLQGSAINRRDTLKTPSPAVMPQAPKASSPAAPAPSAVMEYTVRLVRTEGSGLGLDVVPNFKAATLVVKRVKSGLVEDWNRSNPSNRVTAGDEVFEVNGFQGDARTLASQCVDSGRQLVMKLYRKGKELQQEGQTSPDSSDRQRQIAKGLLEAATVTTASNPLVAAGLKAAAATLAKAPLGTSERRREVARGLLEAAAVTTASDPRVVAGLKAAAATVEKELWQGQPPRPEDADSKARALTSEACDIEMWMTTPESTTASLTSMLGSTASTINTQLASTTASASSKTQFLGLNDMPAIFIVVYSTRVAGKAPVQDAERAKKREAVRQKAATFLGRAAADGRLQQALVEMKRDQGAVPAGEAQLQMQRRPPLAKKELGYICHTWMPTADAKPTCSLWECKDEAAAKSFQSFIDGPDGMGKDKLVNNCYRIVSAGNFREMPAGMLPQSKFANDLLGQVHSTTGCFFWVLHRFRSDKAISTTSWWENMNKILTSPTDVQRLVERQHALGFHNHNFLAAGVDGPIFCVWECQADLSQADFQKFVDGPDGLGPGVFANEVQKVAAGAIIPSAYFKVSPSTAQASSQSPSQSPKAARDQAAAKQALRCGQRVLLASQGGTIRFLGPTLFANGVWVGVELDRPLGKNNGSVNNVDYFSCKPKHGIFVREEVVTVEGRQEVVTKMIDETATNAQDGNNGSWIEIDKESATLRSPTSPPLAPEVLPLVPIVATASWSDQELAQAWSTYPIEGWVQQDAAASPSWTEKVPREKSEDWTNVSICVRRDVVGNHSRERFTERPAEGEFLRLRYRCLSLLGQGYFTTAYLAEDTRKTDTRSQRKFMVCVKKHHRLSFEALTDLMAIGKRVEDVDPDCMYFPRFLDAFHDVASFTVETLVDGKNCLAIAKADPTFFADLAKLQVVARDCLRGLVLLARAKVVHNDMKPDNFMWVQGSDKKGPSVKLVDFGCTRLDQQEEPGRNWALGEGGAGHVGKWSPEMALRLPISPVADVWGLSVSLCELHTGRAVWRDERDACETVLAQSIGLCGLANGLPRELLQRSPVDVRIMFSPSPRHFPVRRNALGMMEALEPSAVGLEQVVGDDWRNEPSKRDFRELLFATFMADPLDRPPAEEVLQLCRFVQEPQERME